MVPYLINRANLSEEDFRYKLRIRFGLMPLDLRQTYNGCGDKLMVEHALQCKRGGIVTFHHNNVADEWGTLYVAALIP